MEAIDLESSVGGDGLGFASIEIGSSMQAAEMGNVRIHQLLLLK